jgi:DNA replication protein DnaC
MGYSAEVIRRARQRLEQAKADRESENRQNLQTAYQQVPRIREIDRQLRQTMAVAVQTAFSKGIDVRQAMNNVKEQNLNLQRERAALAALHFEEGFLDETPICDRCGGSGYVGSTMCECLVELCRQEQKKELTFLTAGRESFDQFRLDYYPDRADPATGFNIRAVMDRTYQTCRRYAMNFSDKSGNLLFSGDTGLGKTFLSACIARTVADSGHSVVYETAGHLFGHLERARFGGSEEDRREAEKYTACDLLIVDDLGTEMGGQFVSASLYTLINDRILAGKPTIISTNLTVDEMSKRYSPQIASRLRGNYTRVAFLGDDIRVMKNRRM